MRKKKMLPKDLFFMEKISSIVLAVVLIANLFFGYIPALAANGDVQETGAAPQYRNVMYYGEWSIYSGQKNYTPDKIPGNYITHLNFAFMDVDENGNVISCDTWADFENPNVGYGAGFDSTWAGVVPALIQLRNQYPNMKIGFSVGGWTRSGDFPKVAASETARKNFARNIAEAAHLYGYDFVDIDWEYPTADRNPDPSGNGVTVDKGCKGSPADKENFTLLLQELRNALDSYGKKDGKHYELSVAMSASPAMMKQIEYDKVLDIVDFANMMTYDLNGAWSAYTGHQTALYTNEAYDHESQTDGQFSVNACVQYLYDTYGDTIDASKIVIGVAPYTRGWAGVQKDGRDPKNPGLYATAAPNSVKAADGTTSGTYAFGDIDTLAGQYGLKEYYDETAQAAYYYNEDTGYFFTCDNERSVTAKAQYVKNEQFKNPFNKPLGGLISWMASLDSASTITKTSYNALFGSGSEQKAQKIEFPAMENVSAKVTVSGNDYVITVKNNNTVSTPKNKGTLHGAAEANVLYYAEKFAGTATYPVFYIKTADGAKLSGSAWSAGGTIGKSGDYTTVTYSNWPYYLGTADSGYSEITLKLTSSTKPDVSKITEIGMTRRVKDGAKEFGWTNLYQGSSETKPAETGSQTETVNTQTEKESTKPAQTTESVETTEPAQTTESVETTVLAQTTESVETTADAKEDSGNAGQYPLWSPDNVHYRIGDLVYYEGSVYECTYEHNSNVAWTPQAAFTLWKERPDLKGSPATTKPAEENTEESTQKDGEGSDNNYTVNGVLPQHTVTGYWHNFSNGSANLKLSDVPAYYDLICVAFTGNTSVPGEATFSVSDDLKKSIGYSDAEFIQDIKTLKTKGQHVIISVGGAEGRIEINSEAAAEKFAQSMISIIEKFGFEGVDIDLEGAAVSGTNYIAGALRKMYDHFGKDFIITMAPETAYMTPNGAGFSSYYWNLAMSIKDILTTVHTQFYNSGSMNGYGGSVTAPGNGSFPANLSTLYIESGLRPDQVAIGVPSSRQAAGSGQITPQQAAGAFNAMIYGTTVDGFTPPKAYPSFRGLMTWSINWDATQDYVWAKAAREAVDRAPVQETTTTESQETTTTEPQESTTQTPEESETPEEKQPLKPLGVTAESRNDYEITVIWSDNDEMRSLGQTFNVYVDGNLQLSNVLCGTYTITPVSAGNHTVTVTGALGEKESEGVSVTVTVKGSEEGSSQKTEETTTEQAEETTTEHTEETTAPVQKPEIVTSADLEINGFWISYTAEGIRTVYSRKPEIDGKAVVEQGLVYGLGKYTDEQDLYVGNTNPYVKAFDGTQKGKLEHQYSKMDDALSYAITVPFSDKTVSEYTAKRIVRAYVKLEDNSYVYSEVVTYTIYDIAEKLYQQAKMNNIKGHNYLYNDILKVVTPEYKEIDFDWTGSIVK